MREFMKDNTTRQYLEGVNILHRRDVSVFGNIGEAFHLVLLDDTVAELFDHQKAFRKMRAELFYSTMKSPTVILDLAGFSFSYALSLECLR